MHDLRRGNRLPSVHHRRNKGLRGHGSDSGHCAPAHRHTACLSQAQSPLLDSFNPGADRSVHSLAVQPDGRILVGGSQIARFNNTGPARQNLVYDASTITWLRGGTRVDSRGIILAPVALSETLLAVTRKPDHVAAIQRVPDVSSSGEKMVAGPAHRHPADFGSHHCF